MSMSALSMLQEAQTARNIAAFQALANMRHEHDELNNSSAMSPPSMVGGTHSNEPANFYANLFGGAPMGLLTPQMIAANQFNTAALLSKLYPHPLLSWQLPSMGNAAASPPISPTSPISSKSLKKLNNNNNNNNIVSTTTNDEYTNNNYKLTIADDLHNKHDDTNTYASIIQSPTTGKKSTNRKSINYKKKRNTDLYKPYAKLEPTSPINTELTVSPGPISPPTSGSSPQSIGSIELQSPSSSSVAAKETTRDKTFTCQTCNRSFGYKHVLQNHERTHTGEKPYACPICSKRFTRDHHLKTHMRLHTGEKPYHCEHCDRQFVQVANLRRHLRVHTGEKPYTCSICSSKFSDSNQLKSHAIIHQDEKPYRCHTCDATFRRSNHLVSHKCTGTVNNSPLTPAMSPVMSMDTKSIASRSDVSQDDLLDLSTQSAALIKNLTLNFNHYHQSHNGNSNNNNNNNNKSSSNLLSSPTKREQTYDHHNAKDNANDYTDAQDMPLDLSIDSSNSDSGKNRSDSV